MNITNALEILNSRKESDFRDFPKLEFKAVYITNTRSGEYEYRSLPIKEAEEMYTTVGLYMFTKEGDKLEEKHVADMSREDFQRILDSRYPNGFRSWQESHYEIVLALNEKSEDGGFPPQVEQANQFIGPGSSYIIATQMTREFELLRKKHPIAEEDLRKDVRNWVKEELKKPDRFISPFLGRNMFP